MPVDSTLQNMLFHLSNKLQKQVQTLRHHPHLANEASLLTVMVEEKLATALIELVPLAIEGNLEGLTTMATKISAYAEILDELTNEEEGN